MSRDLLFEIGVEEIPSAPLYDAVTQLKGDAAKALDAARLTYDTLETYGAPRRLVLRVTELSDRQADQTLRSRGPAAKAAFDDDGNPTPAALGFARGKGIDVSQLVRDTEPDGGEYVYAVVEHVGGAATDVLPALLAQLAEGLAWPKSQRWGSGAARFIRPVRTLLALLGDEVVPVEFAGLTAGRVTFGHRFLAPRREIELSSAGDYDAAAEEGRFVYDAEGRAEAIRVGIAALEAQHGVRAVVPEKTFAEVVNLVEWPTVVMGHFDAEFLEVPREVIETAMTKHQRYFPVEGDDGALTNGFIVVHNGDPARSAEIVAGHERVIRARLSDAAFFYREDLAVSMESWIASLEAITFQEKLGSSGAKVARIEALTERLAALAGTDPAEMARAERAAHLAKADLVSHVVVEFPVLQGVMGRYYALASGESEEVATAVVEHYQPRFAGDAVPSTVAGMLVSAADKLDTMVGIFAIGQAPTGSADPYALRRGAIGILTMVLEGGLRIRLDEAIGAALAGYEGSLAGLDGPEVGRAVHEFLLGRLETILRDRGHAYDTVAAVLATSGDDPLDALKRCEALTNARATAGETFADLSVAFTRARNLSKPGLGTDTDASIMGTEETALADALAAAEADAATSFAAGDYDSVLGVLADLRGPIDTFFDKVLVMDTDEKLRDNRLKLLNRFVALFERFADLSRIAE